MIKSYGYTQDGEDTITDLDDVILKVGFRDLKREDERRTIVLMFPYIGEGCFLTLSKEENRMLSRLVEREIEERKNNE